MTLTEHATTMQTKLSAVITELKNNQSAILAHYNAILGGKWGASNKDRVFKYMKNAESAFNDLIVTLEKVLREMRDESSSRGTRLMLLLAMIKTAGHLYRRLMTEQEFLYNEMCSYCASLRIGGVDEAYSAYEKRNTAIMKITEGIFHMIESDSEVVDAGGSKDALSRAFSRLRRAKANLDVREGDARLQVDARSMVNLKYERLKDGTDVMQALQANAKQWLGLQGFPPQMRRSCELAMAMNANDIEQAMIDTIAETMVEIFRKHRELFRACSIKAHIALTHSGSAWEGSYDSSRSTFDETYIALALHPDMITAVLQGDRSFNPVSELYGVLTHELTHAFDWRLNYDDKNARVATGILKEKPMPSTVRLVTAMGRIREEGLARTGQIFLPSMDDEPARRFGMAVVSFDAVFRDIDKAFSTINTAFDELSASSTAKITQYNLNDIYASGVCHAVGMYMAFIITVSKTRKTHGVRFWLCGTDDVRALMWQHGASFLRIKDEYAWLHKWREVTSERDLHEHLVPGKNFTIVIQLEAYARIKDVITAISLMDVKQFFDAYERACKALGLDPKMLTTEKLQHLNHENLKQHQKAIKEIGFF